MSLRQNAVVAVLLFNTHTVLLPIAVALGAQSIAEILVFFWDSHTF